MNSLTTTVDRYLDRLEGELPVLPSTALRVQRTIGKRMMGMACEFASTLQGSSRRAAAETAESVSTVVGTARSARNDAFEAMAVAGRRVSGQARAETKQAAEAIESEAEESVEAGQQAVEEMLEDTVEALEAIDQAVDPVTTPTGEVYEELTKQQLSLRARKMDIAGRSAMNKAELIEALRSAS